MSYYSSEGVTIHQGAAGLGEYFVKLGEIEQARAGGGGVHAFRQGVLSGMGATMRYADGLGGKLCNQGERLDMSAGPPGRCVRVRPRPGTTRRAFFGMGEYFETGGPQPGAFDDGSFMADEQRLDGPFQAWRNGSLGAEAPVVTLDLADKQALRQYKMMLGFALGRQDLPLDDPTWDAMTEAAYKSIAAQPSSPHIRIHNGHIVPTVGGTQVVVAGLMMNPTATPAWVAANLPKISAWLMAGASTGTYGEVKTPLLPGQKGGIGGIKMSTIAFVGLGAAAATGVYLIFRKKKRMTTNRRRKAA